jgi:hypothetical protein
VNEDAKIEKINSIKGNAHKMSEILKQKYNQQKKDNVNRMKVEEEIRLQKASEIEAEEEALKQKRVQKMMDFKKMQNEDHMMKLETK